MTLIIGINGSPHNDGATAKALATVMKQAEKDGAETKTLHLRDYIQQLFDGDYMDKPAGKVAELLDIIKQADGLVLATPTHWFNVSGLMKTLLDEISHLEHPGFALEGKVVACLATCDEDGGTQACLNMLAPFIHLGCVAVPYGILFRNSSMQGGEEDWQDKDLSLMGSNIAQLATKLKDRQGSWGYERMTQ